MPFGQEWNPQITQNHYKFTGKERDSEDNLDYFGARYYSSTLGRWMSPDWSDQPEAVPYANLSAPQSLNLYGYVRNNPMSNKDEDGHGVDGLLEEVGEDLIIEHPEMADAAIATAGSTVSRFGFAVLGRVAGGTLGFIVGEMAFPSSVGQSDAEERAAIQRSQQQNEQQSQQQPAEPQTAAGGAGAKKGGGRNEQKSNPDRTRTAEENFDERQI